MDNSCSQPLFEISGMLSHLIIRKIEINKTRKPCAYAYNIIQRGRTPIENRKINNFRSEFHPEAIQGSSQEHAIHFPKVRSKGPKVQSKIENIQNKKFR